MHSRRAPGSRGSNPAPRAVIGEAGLAAITPSLFSRPALWSDLALPSEQHGLRAAANAAGDDEVPREHEAAEVAVEWPTP